MNSNTPNRSKNRRRFVSKIVNKSLLHHHKQLPMLSFENPGYPSSDPTSFGPFSLNPRRRLHTHHSCLRSHHHHPTRKQPELQQNSSKPPLKQSIRARQNPLPAPTREHLFVNAKIGKMNAPTGTRTRTVSNFEFMSA